MIATAGIVLTLALTLVAVTVYTTRAIREENQRRCQVAVEAREDGRAMWLYLGELFPDEQVITLLGDELDERLPSLVCVGTSPIPVRK